MLTDWARNGIFGYGEGWGNGNTQTQTTTTGNATIASVDSFGSPVRPATNPNGTPYTGDLRSGDQRRFLKGSLRFNF